MQNRISRAKGNKLPQCKTVTGSNSSLLVFPCSPSLNAANLKNQYFSPIHASDLRTIQVEICFCVAALSATFYHLLYYVAVRQALDVGDPPSWQYKQATTVAPDSVVAASLTHTLLCPNSEGPLTFWVHASAKAANF